MTDDKIYSHITRVFGCGTSRMEPLHPLFGCSLDFGNGAAPSGVWLKVLGRKNGCHFNGVKIPDTLGPPVIPVEPSASACASGTVVAARGAPPPPPPWPRGARTPAERAGSRSSPPPSARARAACPAANTWRGRRTRRGVGPACPAAAGHLGPPAAPPHPVARTRHRRRIRARARRSRWIRARPSSGPPDPHAAPARPSAPPPPRASSAAAAGLGRHRRAPPAGASRRGQRGRAARVGGESAAGGAARGGGC